MLDTRFFHVQVFTWTSPICKLTLHPSGCNPAHKHLIRESVLQSVHCNTDSLYRCSSCHFRNDTPDKLISKRQFSWQHVVLRLRETNKSLTWSKEHDKSSNWLCTAVTQNKSAALYSPQWTEMRWKWSLSHRTGWSQDGRCYWGSVCSNDDVYWAGNGVVIPGYSPQWRAVIGWLILVWLYYRVKTTEHCFISSNLSSYVTSSSNVHFIFL